jgi:hypothetical protein
MNARFVLVMFELVSMIADAARAFGSRMFAHEAAATLVSPLVLLKLQQPGFDTPTTASLRKWELNLYTKARFVMAKSPRLPHGSCVSRRRLLHIFDLFASAVAGLHMQQQYWLGLTALVGHRRHAQPQACNPEVQPWGSTSQKTSQPLSLTKTILLPGHYGP